MPSAAHWREAAGNALRDPDTWMPAVAASAVAVSGRDGEIVRWATRETPLFGSSDRAGDASDLLKGAAHAVMIGSAIGIHRDDWRAAARRIVEQEVIVLPVQATTGAIKVTVGRERPDASNRRSFPSGHASTAAAYGTLARNNGAWRSVAAGSRLLTAATGWARVEAGVHYPTDVLTGAALGNFLASLLDDLWPKKYGAAIEISRRRVSVSVAVRR